MTPPTIPTTPEAMALWLWRAWTDNPHAEIPTKWSSCSFNEATAVLALVAAARAEGRAEALGDVTRAEVEIARHGWWSVEGGQERLSPAINAVLASRRTPPAPPEPAVDPTEMAERFAG